MIPLPKESRRFFEQCGRRGGRVRARSLSSSRRSLIASEAARRRWGRGKQTEKLMPSVRLERIDWNNPVYLEEVLSEGTLREWGEIYRQIADRPFGPTAGALKQVLSSSTTYGITSLWKGILRRVQGIP